MNLNKAFLIKNILEYGKLMAYCIEHDISVWRTYWDDREADDRCYVINWYEKRCYYCSYSYWKNEGYEIVIPYFYVNKYGQYKIRSEKQC